MPPSPAQDIRPPNESAPLAIKAETRNHGGTRGEPCDERAPHTAPLSDASIRHYSPSASSTMARRSVGWLQRH
jgi:hypothetical protein